MKTCSVPQDPVHRPRWPSALPALLRAFRAALRPPPRLQRHLVCWLLLSVVSAGVGAAKARGAETLTLEVMGVEGEAQENVEALLEPPRNLVRDGRINEMWLKRYRRQVPDRVRQALIPFGYYQPQVETRLNRRGEKRYVLEVDIDPGRAVRVAGRRLRIEGHRHRLLVQKLEDFPLHSGDVLRQDIYEQAKGELKALAVDLGYLDARFTEHTLRVDPSDHAAEIFLTLKTGSRYLFGEFDLSGAPRYPERFLRRYLAARPGEVFSFEKLGKTQQNFFDSDRFRSVVINPHPGQAEERRVPVSIQLEPSARRRLRPGIGYGTDTGARLSLKYQDVNMLQLGHELDIDLLLAERLTNITAHYILPGYRNVDTLLALRGGYRQERLETYDTEFVFAEIERIHGFTRGRKGSYFLRLQAESSDVGGDKTSSIFLLPGVRFSQVRFDDPVRPREGYRYSMEVRGTHRSLLSDISLGQAIADANLLVPLPWRFYLLVRGNAGVTWQNDDIEDIPASLRFFTGGDRSVRGYAFQSLGPEKDGEVAGGKNLLVGSLEMERRFFANWGMAVFYDTGNAFNNFSSINLKRSVGIGGRYYTPVGPVRVDLARQLGEDDPSFRLHVGIGLGW